jgi:hypothetical protein
MVRGENGQVSSLGFALAKGLNTATLTGSKLPAAIDYEWVASYCSYMTTVVGQVQCRE